MEWWSDGVMEWWSDGCQASNTPTLHHTTTPSSLALANMRL